MATKAQIIGDLNWTTEKLSSLIWYINIGTLGTAWSAVISTAKDDAFKVTFYEARWIFALCLVALLFELGQYISAYFQTKSVLDLMEAHKSETSTYDKSSLLYKVRKLFFGAKIISTILAATLLLGLIFWKLGGG